MEILSLVGRVLVSAATSMTSAASSLSERLGEKLPSSNLYNRYNRYEGYSHPEDT